MAHTYEYAVLVATPDPRRGERVNVGIAVFRNDRLDVRFEHAVYKLRALTGQNLDSKVELALDKFQKIFDPEAATQDMLKSMERLEPMLKPSGTGRLTAADDEQYEARVAEILKSLVKLPKREKRESRSRINTEMAKSFKRVKILASGEETVDDKKVVRNFTIDDAENLSADFALKNGRLYVTSTLDLRKQNASMSEAALKSIILDKADKKFSGAVGKIGVYAVDKGMLGDFRPHLNLLEDYADVIFDWQDADGKRKLSRYIYDVIGTEGDLL